MIDKQEPKLEGHYNEDIYESKQQSRNTIPSVPVLYDPSMESYSTYNSTFANVQLHFLEGINGILVAEGHVWLNSM